MIRALQAAGSPRLLTRTSSRLAFCNKPSAFLGPAHTLFHRLGLSRLPNFRERIGEHRAAAVMSEAQSDANKPNEEPRDVHQEAQLLAEFAEIPGISAAWVGAVTQDANQITVQYGQRDVSANKLRKYLRTFTAPKTLEGPLKVLPSFPVEMRDVLLHSVSPSGGQQLIARAAKDGSAIVLEIWKGSRVVRELHVPKDLHGSIYNDNWFSQEPSWNADETRIAYVAESPTSTSKTPEWGVHKSGDDSPKSVDKEKSSGPEAGPKGWRGIGEFQEDWGELNTGKRTPKLYVVNISKGKVTPVAGLPEDSSTGQPVWTPDGAGLVFVSWPHKSLNFPTLPQRLGIVFCTNRPCFLYHVIMAQSTDDSKPAEKLETGLQSALSPNFSPDGRHLYFLAHQEAVSSGAHHGSVTLERIAWPHQGQRQTVIGVVRRPSSTEDFPGLFAVPFKCLTYGFISNTRILLTSQWRSTIQILDVKISDDGKDIDISRASDITGPAPSSILLAVRHGKAMAVRSGPRQPPYLVLADASSDALQWYPVSAEEPPFPQQVASFLDSDQPSYHTLQVASTTEPTGLAFEAVLLMNRDGKKNAPTVLVVHGGPHSAYPAVYILSNAYLTALGYNVLQVNYRGSLGFGEDNVQSLLGHIGTNDVADCIAALDAAVEQGYVDASKVAVIGGSHGGFLTGHLLGQHPDRFKAGVLRNPVLDLSLMSQISDIPDWVFVEAFGSQEGRKLARVKPSTEELKRLEEISPIHHISRVKAPMFFMLGAKDRRVVMRDSHQYVAAMKAQENPVETRVIVYPNDTHALDQPQTEFEQFINAAWWLKRFL